MTASAGGGLGFPVGGSALIGPTVSNAQRVSDLGGPFAYGWGSFGEGIYSGGGSFEVGHNSCGRTIWQATGGWTPGVDLPTPFSFGGGLNYTWTSGG